MYFVFLFGFRSVGELHAKSIFFPVQPNCGCFLAPKPIQLSNLVILSPLRMGTRTGHRGNADLLTASVAQIIEEGLPDAGADSVTSRVAREQIVNCVVHVVVIRQAPSILPHIFPPQGTFLALESIPVLREKDKGEWTLLVGKSTPDIGVIGSEELVPGILVRGPQIVMSEVPAMVRGEHDDVALVRHEILDEIRVSQVVVFETRPRLVMVDQTVNMSETFPRTQ